MQPCLSCGRDLHAFGRSPRVHDGRDLDADLRKPDRSQVGVVVC